MVQILEVFLALSLIYQVASTQLGHAAASTKSQKLKFFPISQQEYESVLRLMRELQPAESQGRAVSEDHRSIGEWGTNLPQSWSKIFDWDRFYDDGVKSYPMCVLKTNGHRTRSRKRNGRAVEPEYAGVVPTVVYVPREMGEVPVPEEPGPDEPGNGTENPNPEEPSTERPDPEHPGHGYPGHGYPGHGYPGHGYPGHGYPGHGYPGHGYPGHGYPGHGYPGHGYPGHGYPDHGHPPGHNVNSPGHKGKVRPVVNCVVVIRRKNKKPKPDKDTDSPSHSYPYPHHRPPPHYRPHPYPYPYPYPYPPPYYGYPGYPPYGYPHHHYPPHKYPPPPPPTKPEPEDNTRQLNDDTTIAAMDPATQQKYQTMLADYYEHMVESGRGWTIVGAYDADGEDSDEREDADDEIDDIDETVTGEKVDSSNKN